MSCTGVVCWWNGAGGTVLVVFGSVVFGSLVGRAVVLDQAIRRIRMVNKSLVDN
jgi:hypothetical protein